MTLQTTIIAGSTPTPHTAAAIIRQIESKSDVWAECDANGMTFQVGFSVDCEWESSLSPYASGYVCECKVIGAWAENEDGDVTFAGSRAELVALVGEKTVAAWEDSEGDNAAEREAA